MQVFNDFQLHKTDLNGPKDGQVKLTRDLQNSKVFSCQNFYHLMDSLV